MQHLQDLFNELVAHEYILATLGVVLWEIEQFFAKKVKTWKKFWGNTGRSLVWVGLLVAFDDELLARYNAIMLVDYEHPPLWMYVLIGFVTDIVRTKFTKKVQADDDIAVA